jgi:hypothetical protein
LWRSTRLVDADQEEAAPLAGGRRNSADGEDLRGRTSVTDEE